MKNEDIETREGLNQLFEIINAKGDIGELKEIVEVPQTSSIDNENANKKTLH